MSVLNWNRQAKGKYLAVVNGLGSSWRFTVDSWPGGMWMVQIHMDGRCILKTVEADLTRGQQVLELEAVLIQDRIKAAQRERTHQKITAHWNEKRNGS